ncbi:helix-turn-helix transcriptional regulator [Halobacteriales archaeon Cl-PHB]
MDLRALQSTRLFAAVLFVAAALVLATQLITPSPVMVRVGEEGTTVAELGNYFRYADVGIVAVAASLLGASGTFLLTADRPGPERRGDSPGMDRNPDAEPTEDVLAARREEWEATAERLADNERAIYETVMEADGVLAQTDIVERTDLSKATVSRLLDSLETKDLVQRKRRGMGNVVLLL